MATISRKGAGSDTGNRAHFAPTVHSVPEFVFEPNGIVEEGEMGDFWGSEGGDAQTGPTFSRRFRINREDGLFAFATASYYATTEYRELDDKGEETGNQSYDEDDFDSFTTFYDVQCQTEFLVCSDPDDLGGTEINSDYIYENSEPYTMSTHEEAVEASRRACLRESVGNYELWDGEIR
jgi:hypothetical protein